MRESEILIIGGGMAGTSTAYHLSQYGYTVTLLERSELAAEASGLHAGTIWATGWGISPDLSSTLSMGGLEICKMVQFDRGCDIEFLQSGSLKGIQTEEQAAFAGEEAQDLMDRGHALEILAARDAHSIEPALSQDISGYVYYPHGGMANPVKTTNALAKLARQPPRGAAPASRGSHARRGFPEGL